MKKILLIGDSIRMGYDSYTKESMKNVAEVYYPRENCTFTTYILRNLHGWTDALGLFEADAVHFNAGLWDTVRIYGDGPLIKAQEYADNLERIVKRIRFLFPTAKIVFATSTPVMEDRYIQDFETRLNADVVEYNRIAKKVMETLGVRVNDLHALLDGRDELHSDQTHYYTAEGTRLIGERVTSVLCEELGIDKALLTPPSLDNYVRPGSGLSDRELYEKKGHVYVIKRG